jgi:HD-GYP domain-containing protein (c-di-GMP phosphodiesterase class II)
VAKVLLVGPNRERTVGIRSLLRDDGHIVSLLRSVSSWRDAESEVLPDLVIAAVNDCDSMLRRSGRPPRGFPPPLLFVQTEAEIFQDHYLPQRLIDHIASPFMQEELLARADALIRVRRVIRRGGDAEVSPLPDGEDLQEAGDQDGTLRRFGGKIAALMTSRVPRHVKPLGPYAEVAARVADWADRRDGLEPGHAERVTAFCNMIADGLQMPKESANSLLRAAMLHDIGKVGIPVELLQKKGPLEEDQMRLLRTHPKKGAALMRALDKDEDVARTILYHHERPDGNGYYGKSERAIPLEAKALAVAETYDAMTRSRVRATVSSEAALRCLSDQKNRSFDPDCVEALTDALRPRQSSIPLSTPGF